MTFPKTTPYPPFPWTQNLLAVGDRAKALLANQWELSRRRPNLADGAVV